MKQLVGLVIIVLLLGGISCTDGPGSNRSASHKHEADTGFTGTKYFNKGDYRVKEIEYKNGVRSGITRTFYNGGTLKEEIMYSDNRKNGDARWYYPDGILFRITPYLNDTINGTQIQYYKNGRIKARIEYVDGKRVPGLEEYKMNGIRISNYPDITYHTVDYYKERGLYKVFVEMSDLSENVKYYRGDFVDGLVDLSVCTEILQTATTGYLDLRKASGISSDSVTVVASYLTDFGNRLYYRIAIPLPYNDLK